MAGPATPGGRRQPSAAQRFTSDRDGTRLYGKPTITQLFAIHECYPRSRKPRLSAVQKRQNPGNPGVLLQADEGIRTLDLRHGNLRVPPGTVLTIGPVD
jgi:hypothetical protein